MFPRTTFYMRVKSPSHTVMLVLSAGAVYHLVDEIVQDCLWSLLTTVQK